MSSQSACGLSNLVLQAAADQTKWAAVLQFMISMCGAVAGIIMVREIEAASLLPPKKLTAEPGAPLFQGLKAEFIASYIDHYAKLDPWSAIERQHHPHTPYFMSDHPSVASLWKKEFGKWIEPQGIEDAIVAEIHRSRCHWVALNLYFDKSARNRKPQILKSLSQMLPALNTGWHIAEEIADLRQRVLAGQGYLEGWPVPCLIFDEKFVITSANKTGLKEFPRHLGSSTALAMGGLISTDHPSLLKGIEHLIASPRNIDGGLNMICIKSLVPGYSIHIAIVAQATDVIGRKRTQFVAYVKAACGAPAAGMATTKIWENPMLTARQAAIVHWIAEGGTIPQFARHYQISTKTAYDHLLTARQKLNNISARDIYTTHQAYRMLEEAMIDTNT